MPGTSSWRSASHTHWNTAKVRSWTRFCAWPAARAIHRTSIAAPPYTITNTPPLYLLLQVPFASILGPAFWYGRAISVISLLFAAVFLGLTLYELSKIGWPAAVGGLLLFCVPNLWNWSVFDRVDLLALALSWAGLYAIVRWPERRRRVWRSGEFLHRRDLRPTNLCPGRPGRRAGLAGADGRAAGPPRFWGEPPRPAWRSSW